MAAIQDVGVCYAQRITRQSGCRRRRPLTIQHKHQTRLVGYTVNIQKNSIRPKTLYFTTIVWSVILDSDFSCEYFLCLLFFPSTQQDSGIDSIRHHKTWGRWVQTASHSQTSLISNFREKKWVYFQFHARHTMVCIEEIG